MASALLDQVSVDIADPSGRIRLRAHRLGRRVRRLPQALPGRPRRRRRGGRARARRLPAMRERERLARGAVSPNQHFTQPPPRYTEASLVKKLEELGHRPALDLRLDHPGPAGPRLCAAREAALPAGGPRPARHRVPDQLFRALCRVQFHRRPGKPARRGLRRAGRLEGVAAPLLAGFLGRDRRHQGPDDQRRCSTRSTPNSAGISSRRTASRPRPAPVPGLRRRPAVAEARPLRRLHRLLELSGVPLHPARFGVDGATTESRAGAAETVLGTDPATGQRVTVKKGPYGHYVQLGEADERREAEAGRVAARAEAGRYRSRYGAAAAGAAARDRRGIRRPASRSPPGSAGSAPYIKHGTHVRVARRR